MDFYQWGGVEEGIEEDGADAYKDEVQDEDLADY